MSKKHWRANSSLIKMHKELICTFDGDSDPCASHFSAIIATASMTLIYGPQRPTHSVKKPLTPSLEPTLGHFSSTKQPQRVELVFSGQSRSVNRTSQLLFNPVICRVLIGSTTLRNSATGYLCQGDDLNTESTLSTIFCNIFIIAKYGKQGKHLTLVTDQQDIENF